VPRLSVWYLRAALLYLGFGFTLGAVMLGAPALQLSVPLARLRLLHAEILLVGWTVQLALGVAYWILPKERGEAARRGGRLALVSLFLLNLGVAAAAFGAISGFPAISAAGRTAELLAVLTFALHAWPRVRASSALRRD
jgi:heme/copper-type cytochrome/quinol oxidase subunit 1